MAQETYVCEKCGHTMTVEVKPGQKQEPPACCGVPMKKKS